MHAIGLMSKFSFLEGSLHMFMTFVHVVFDTNLPLHVVLSELSWKPS